MASNDAVADILPWDQRANAVQPMPGGYSGYMHSLRTICYTINESSLTFSELVNWMCAEYDLSQRSAQMRLRFLEKAGLINQPEGIMRLEEQTRTWLAESGEDKQIIAVMHRHVKFMGEMLSELEDPKSIEQLRQVAATHYGIDWQLQTQINNRRGWFESANLIETSSHGLELTPDGHDLLSKLLTQQRDKTQTLEFRVGESRQDPLLTNLDILSSEILASSTDSGNPTRFERAVRDAFRFIGYVSEHISGSGKTDVLLTAPLGRDALYRVAVDAKTTASGSLSDGQVDWATLKDHRELHRADYSLLVAPRPTGQRLFLRAKEFSVCVLSADQLVELCRTHAGGQLSLVEYRQLFANPGEIDLSSVVEQADHYMRLRRVATTICGLLPEKTNQHGPMSARDIQLVLHDEEPEVSESEIKLLLEMLSHPLVGAVHKFNGDRNLGSTNGYVLASSRSTCRRRIELLAREIGEFWEADTSQDL